MEIVKQFSPALQREIKAHIRDHLMPLATPEKAKCARGRQQLWIQAEPDYKGKYRKAHADQRLWRFCQHIYPAAGLAQIYSSAGNHGISWHRDHAFAQSKAYIVNLGTVCLQTKLENGRLISLELTGGEVIQFNCKLQHQAIPRSKTRIGIAIWADKISLDDPKNWL